MRLAPDELEELLAKLLANLEFRPRQDLAVFGENGSEMYKVAGFVVASSRTVRWSPSGLMAAETRMLVSMTRRSGIIRACVFARGPP